MQFIGYGRPESVAESQSRLDEYLDGQRRQGWTKWRVENRAGEMIGRAGFGEVDSCRDLAYTFRRDQWGRGFATEIASALVEWNLEHPDRELLSSSLCAHVEVRHGASGGSWRRSDSISWTGHPGQPPSKSRYPGNR
ncbi:hypothetical protein B2J88_46015 [Rhodococcus sp. SRB_17]|nr:hypothetical protein [Rhodococcus sp. SRB_17]